MFRQVTFVVFLLMVGFNSFSQWQVIPNVIGTENLYSMYFINDTTAYIGGRTKVASTSDDFNSFYAPTFQVDNMGFPITYYMGQVNDLYFTSATDGFCTGSSYNAGEYVIFNTTNSGGLWYFDIQNNIGGLIRYVSTFDFQGTNAIACGAQGHVWKSINSGLNWTQVNSNTQETILDISFLQSPKALACGDGVILRSSDLGNTWAADTTFHQLTYNIAHRPGSSIIYISAYNSLLKSVNSGTNLFEIKLPFNAEHVETISDDTLIASTNIGICISYNGGYAWQQYKFTKPYHSNKVYFRRPYIYGVCDGGNIIRANLYTTPAQPIAAFDVIDNDTCNLHQLLFNNLSDSGYTYSWYLNGNLVSNTYNYSKSYYSDTTNQQFQLIVSSAGGSDTMVYNTGIYVRPSAIAIASADFSGCYGQEFILYGKDTLNQTMEWKPGIKINWYWTPVNTDSVLTTPVRVPADTIWLVTNNWANCPDSDFVILYTSDSIYVPFIKTETHIKDVCGNDPCNYISSLSFVDDLYGFGYANSGEFLKTVDGGITYSRLNIDSIYSLGIGPDHRYDVQFFNRDTGYIGYGIMKTVDGGAHFTQFPLVPPIRNAQLSFLNPDTGIFGSHDAGSDCVYLTLNGGQTYNSIYNTNTWGAIYSFDLAMVSRDTMYIGGAAVYTGDFRKLMKTVNGGTSWTSITLPQKSYGNDQIISISAVSGDTIFAVTRDHYVLRSFDGGTTIDEYYLGTMNGYTWNTIKMINGRVGYIGGSDGQIFTTDNHGDCWTQIFDSDFGPCEAIAITPSRSQLYFAFEDGFNRTAVIYRTQSYCYLHASIDSAQCVDQQICTQNLSTGYTSHKWYLDNVLVSTSRDTCFNFLVAGAHVLKLKCDSAGIKKDSTIFNLNILAAPGSVSPIIGDTNVCTNYSISPGNDHDYLAQINPKVESYFWFEYFPNNITYGLEGETDSLATVYFDPNSNWSTQEYIYCYGITATGCRTDTASLKIYLHHNVPPDPIDLAVSPPCVQLLYSALGQNVIGDSVYCTTTTPLDNQTSQFWFPGNPYSSNQSAYEYIYRDCPGPRQATVYSRNECGTSANYFSASYDVEYKIIGMVKTPDTTVVELDYLKLRCFPQMDQDVLQNCTVPNILWYKDGVFTGFTGNILSKFVFLSDSGIYIAAIINSCGDTTFENIHVTVTPIINVSENISTFLKVNDDGKNLNIFNSSDKEFELVLSDMLSRTIIQKKIYPGWNKFDFDYLPEQLYLANILGEKSAMRYRFLKR